MAAQTPEAQAFIQRVVSLPRGPGARLDRVLQPSLDDETELRTLFATDKTHPRLADTHVGLVDVFDAPVDLRTTRARVVKEGDRHFREKFIMPVPDLRRRAEGTPSTVTNVREFQANLDAFTGGSLSQLDWKNVVAAGGSVLACLTPLPDDREEQRGVWRSMSEIKTALTAHYSGCYPTSDVDLFLWGLTPDEAEEKIVNIYEAVRGSVPNHIMMTCVRTKHTVTIHSQFPFRTVQIILRLYTSPAEILAGFDIDSACFSYDGDHIYASPRAVIAVMRQANTIDMTRRSPSYESRLAKYGQRYYEIYVPSLSRAAVDPMIYQRSTRSLFGLARLLALENLANIDGSLRSVESLGHSSNYDVASLQIPYGPHWDAQKTNTLVCVTNMVMNSAEKLRKHRLHRHPAFCGDIETVLKDCCGRCPTPLNANEEELDERYLRGRIAFIQDDPGRQMLSGSFNPVDIGEWSTEVYMGPSEHFFAAIAANDRAGIARMLILILLRMLAGIPADELGL